MTKRLNLKIRRSPSVSQVNWDKSPLGTVMCMNLNLKVYRRYLKLEVLHVIPFYRKYFKFSSNIAKNTKVTLILHDNERERLNISWELVFWHQNFKLNGEMLLWRLDVRFIIALRQHITLCECRKNWILQKTKCHHSI